MKMAPRSTANSQQPSAFNVLVPAAQRLKLVLSPCLQTGVSPGAPAIDRHLIVERSVKFPPLSTPPSQPTPTLLQSTTAASSSSSQAPRHCWTSLSGLTLLALIASSHRCRQHRNRSSRRFSYPANSRLPRSRLLLLPQTTMDFTSQYQFAGGQPYQTFMPIPPLTPSNSHSTGSDDFTTTSPPVSIS